MPARVSTVAMTEAGDMPDEDLIRAKLPAAKLSASDVSAESVVLQHESGQNSHLLIDIIAVILRELVLV